MVGDKSGFRAAAGEKRGQGQHHCIKLDPIGAKSVKHLLTVRFSGLSGKGPLSVRISDRGGGLHQVIPPNFAVQGAATDL